MAENQVIRTNPAYAQSLIKRVQLKMKQRPQAVKAYERTARGGQKDAMSLMETLIKPNYPKKIQEVLNSLDE